MRRLTATLIPAASALLAIAALAGCDTTPKCVDLCDQLVRVCEINAWDDERECAQGCSDELFRHPETADVVDCYEEAADSCDVTGLVDCKHLAFQLGADLDE